MGGRSSSSSATTSTTQNIDARRVIGDHGTSIEGSTIISTDAGAVAAGAQTAGQALQFAGHTVDDFTSTLSTVNRDAMRTASELNRRAVGLGEHAIDTGRDLARDAYGHVDATIGAVLKSEQGVERAYSGAQDTLQKAYADAKGTTASLNTIVLASLGVAAVVAFLALRRG